MDAAQRMDAHFAAVKALLDKALETCGGGRAAAAHTRLAGVRFEFQGVFVCYATATAPARLKLRDARARQNAAGELRAAITSRDFPGELQSFLRRARDALTDAAKARKGGAGGPRRPLDALVEHLDLLARRICGVSSLNDAQAAREAADAAAKAVDAIECDDCDDCGVRLVAEAGGAEARCPECQRLYDLHGFVYEGAQLFSQEGQRGKSGQFNPNRHFDKWLNRIQALGPEAEIGDPLDPDNLGGEKLIHRLGAECERLNIFRHQLNVAQVRMLLKTVGRTDLNQNSSLILKKLTGLEPPILSEEKRVRGEVMFSQVLQHIAATAASAGNRNYYPFYIYKIYDLILDEDDPDRFILWFIHLQGADTLSNNDRDWKPICAEFGWVWRPTDPAKAVQYRSLYGKSNV